MRSTLQTGLHIPFSSQVSICCGDGSCLPSALESVKKILQWGWIQLMTIGSKLLNSVIQKTGVRITFNDVADLNNK